MVEPAAIPIGLRADRAIDAALDDLDSGAGPMFARAGVTRAPVVVARARRNETMPQPDPPHDWPSRLAVILLAAGWFGQGGGPSRAGTARIARRPPGRSADGAAADQQTGGPL